jgi:hypothetical protein
MHALNTSYPTTYPPTDTLFLKLQGSQPSIEHVANTIQGIVQAHGCTGWAFAETAANAEELWKRRKWALGEGLSQEGGPWKGVVTDVWYEDFVLKFFCVSLFLFDPDGYLASQCRNSRSWCWRQRTI